MKKITMFLISLFLFISIVNADGVAVDKELGEYAKNSKSAILIEPSTKTILYEKNSHEKLAPASMTKIMTLLLTMEAIDSGKLSYDDAVLISKRASGMGGTQIFIKEGTNVKVIDLLKGIGIASANDAAVALAEKVGGTYDNFVIMMNKRAKELGAVDTSFKNPHGLDEEGHYSTAYDMSLIASELIKHESILKITSTYEENINVNGQNHWLVNTNKLVRFYNGMDGLKTGFTDKAKYCLTGTMKKNDMRLISVVMGANEKEDRNEDTIAMMEYGFSVYGIKNILKSDKSLGEIYVNNANPRNIKYYASEDINVLVDKNTEEIKYDLKKEFNNIKAPLKKGDVIGKIYLNYNGKIYEYNLVVKENIKKSGYFKMLYNNFKDIISGKVNVI